MNPPPGVNRQAVLIDRKFLLRSSKPVHAILNAARSRLLY